VQAAGLHKKSSMGRVRLVDRFRSARMALRYYWLVARKGWQRTVEDASVAGLVAGAAIFALGSVLGCRWTAGKCDVTSFRAGLAGVAIYGGLILAANVIMAPVRQVQDAP
jgi:hypothetical protein